MIYNAVSDFIRKSDHVAIYYKDQKITYNDLYDNVSRYSNNISKTLNQGDEILIMLNDCPEYFYIFWGAIKAGICPMLLNNKLSEKEKKDIIKKYNPKLIITDENIKDFDQKATNLSDQNSVNTNKSDICFYLFTSGTTGYIQRIPHKHKDIAVTCDNYAKKTLFLNSYDICFSSAKLSFAYGLGNSMTFPLYVGASTVLLSNDSTIKNIFETIEKYKPTVFFGVPTLYSYLCKSLENSKKNLKSIRMFVSAGEALPAPIYKSWIKHTNKPILDGIGTTEALHIFVSNTPDNHEPGCSGILVPGYQAKIVDILDNEVGDGITGRLKIKGNSLIDNSWCDTGDMFIKYDNKFYYQGRSNDMIKVGGVWVSPNAIESKILEHPDVLEVGVIASSDLNGLSKTKAYITLKSNLLDKTKIKREIKRLCIKDLPKNNFPHLIEFIDVMPKTATGKIQRFNLRIFDAFSPIGD